MNSWDEYEWHARQCEAAAALFRAGQPLQAAGVLLRDALNIRTWPQRLRTLPWGVGMASPEDIAKMVDWLAEELVRDSKR